MVDKVQEILDVSSTFASGKRLLILFILKNQPMGYTNIVKNFKKHDISIGTSEVYKHLRKLLEGEYIIKSGKNYILTLKGLNATNNVIDIINTPPHVPRIHMRYSNN